jgi:polysaccharide pyruvyl transferase WcaK-like protein
MRTHKKWLIFGHFGGHNTGDEAMLLGMLNACAPEVREKLVIVYKGEAPQALQKYNVIYIPPKMRTVLSQFWNCRGIVVGGGTHFHDDYTSIRYARHFQYMLRFVLLTIAAKVCGKRAVWISQGFGPFFRWPSRWILRIGLAFCDFVTVREITSKKEIENWIPSNKMELSFDLAALLLSENDILNSARQVQNAKKGQVLGISVTSTENSKTGGPSLGDVFWDRFLNAIRSIFQSDPTLQLRIFVIRGGERESDIGLSNHLFESLALVDPGRIELIPYNPDPTATLKKIGECDAFIATRFHSGVLAYLAGCNLLFVAYHRKLIDLAREIGLVENAWMSMSPEMSESLIQTRIQDLLDDPSPRYQPTLLVQEAVKRSRKNVEVLFRYE